LLFVVGGFSTKGTLPNVFDGTTKSLIFGLAWFTVNVVEADPEK